MNWEMNATEYIRVLHCSMFYSHNLSQWKRITASLTISSESGYWQIPSNHNEKAPDHLPRSVTSSFEKYLMHRGTIKQDSHLSVFLRPRKTLEKNEDAAGPSVKMIKPPFQVELYLQDITALLKHLNCPYYYERQLDQRPLYTYQPNRLFLAHLPPRGWLFEVRLSSDRALIDADLYTLQVLHCLNGAPGINPFVGVVLDDDSGVLCAFLSEIPAKGAILDVIDDAEKTDHPVSWERRLKWCRQLVRGVAEMHAKAFVVGCLWRSPKFGAAVDGNDNAVFLEKFSRTFPHNMFRKGDVPPEFSHIATTVGEIAATPMTDIYHLGSVLWRIAEKEYQLPAPERLHKLAGCTLQAGTPCEETHDRLIQLPSLDPEVPRYFREMIDACRASNPNDRPTAWKLLERFPSDMEGDRGDTAPTADSDLP